MGKKKIFVIPFALAIMLFGATLPVMGFIFETQAVQASTSGKKVKKINKSIAFSLKEDRGWAEGKLDENGHPTDNGTPNENFDYSKYIQKAKYTKDDQGVIYVNSNFFALNKKTRKKFMNTTQNVILSSVADYKKVKNQTYIDSIYVQVKYGNDHIGRAKILDHHEFKWYR